MSVGSRIWSPDNRRFSLSLSQAKLTAHLFTLFAVFILFYVPVSKTTLWWSAAADAMHVILFCVISCQIFFVLQSLCLTLKTYQVVLLTSVTVMSLGFFVELTQSYVARETSLQDLIGDGYGLLAGLCFSLAYRMIYDKKRWMLRVLIMSAGSVALIVGMLPLIQISHAYEQRDAAFPVIMDLSAEWSSTFVRMHKTDFVMADGSEKQGDTVVVRFQAARYPGLALVEPVPDWRHHEALVLELWSPYSRRVELKIRINDASHDGELDDRFNRTIALHEGKNTVTIKTEEIRNAPLNRQMQMGRISSLILFIAGPGEDTEIGVGVIRLR